MYPFVTLAWQPTNRRASQAASALRRALGRSTKPWEPTFECDGMVVFTQVLRTAQTPVYRLPARGGVILGHLFPAEFCEHSPSWRAHISATDVARYLETSGRQLTRDYWGAYVAFLTDRTGIHCLVVRDLSGKLPCYRLRHDGVDILFADVADLIALPLPQLTPNLHYLAASIHSSALQIRATAFKEVTELLAGESYERRGPSGRQQFAWDPRCLVEDLPQTRFHDAALRLRRVTQASINAWASVHSRVLHRLSGGLDSSIVLGCLSRAPSAPSVVCLNHYVEDDAGDERRYARISAERAAARLVEIAADAETLAFDARLLATPPSVKPSFSQCLRMMQIEVVNREARRHQAAAIWTGQGGDHLFLKAANIHSAPDFVADRGVRWELARVVRNEAHRCGKPYAWVLHSTFAGGGAQAGNRQSDRAMHFIDPGALPQDVGQYSVHPWTLAAKDLPPGRQRQIELLADVVNRHRPLSSLEWAYEHHPLLSQPIIEQCLRTPTYVHLEGGRLRALARYAFRDCVPAEILEREDKGSTTPLTVEGLRRSQRFLCELLLEGILAREHLFARAQLESCLRDGQVLRSGQLSPLLACIAAEVWIRAWHRATQTAQAVRRRCQE